MRDEAVFKLVHTVYKIPIAVLLGGGYRVRECYSCTITM